MLFKKRFSQLLTVLAFSGMLAACGTSSEKPQLQNGSWQGELHLQGQELPFQFKVENKNQQAVVTLINGKEELLAGPAEFKGDSVIIPMHIFDAELRAKVEGQHLKGYWIKNYVENYVIPFEAQYSSKDSFEANTQTPAADISGKWRAKFSGKDENDPPVIGLFEQKDGKLQGTFMTTTGDYRFLSGYMQGDEMMLSTFNGENAYLFKAQLLNDSTLQGKFWSGKSRQEDWTAVRDEKVTLPDANKLTYLKEGYDKLAFTFPNLEKEAVSLEDKKYQDKVVLVQIFGTWCPNCMDETKFLAEWYKQNKDRGVEIIGLAYEKKDDFDYAKERVQKMVDRYEVQYDFLIAGSSDNKEAAKTLPMLNHVMSFPTLIFIDKNGEVRKIHTGFSGPGTGKYFEEWAEEFKIFTDKLIEEN
jgi:thiol-disulfide isomerase/thioredoxin